MKPSLIKQIGKPETRQTVHDSSHYKNTVITN